MFWVNVTSNKVYIKSDEKDSVSSKLISDKRTSYYNYLEYQEDEPREAENLTDFMLLFQNKSGSTTMANKTDPIIIQSSGNSSLDMIQHNFSFSNASHNEINEMTQIYANDVSNVETARETTGHENHEIHDTPSAISIISKEPEIEMSSSYTDNYSYTGSENDTGQYITSDNTSLSSSKSPTDALLTSTTTTTTTQGNQAIGTELDLPTSFIINSSSTEKTALHENPENHFTAYNSFEKYNQSYTDSDLTFASISTISTLSTSEAPTTTQKISSVYFRILPTNDEYNEVNEEEPIDHHDKYATFDELEPLVYNSPTFYNENMTEVIIIRKCSTR